MTAAQHLRFVDFRNVWLAYNDVLFSWIEKRTTGWAHRGSQHG